MIFFFRGFHSSVIGRKTAMLSLLGAEMFKNSDAGSKMKLRSKVNMDEMGGQKLWSKVNEVGSRGQEFNALAK